MTTAKSSKDHQKFGANQRIEHNRTQIYYEREFRNIQIQNTHTQDATQRVEYLQAASVRAARVRKNTAQQLKMVASLAPTAANSKNRKESEFLNRREKKTNQNKIYSL